MTYKKPITLMSLCCLGLVACAGGPEPGEPVSPMPSVAELARLRASGELDQTRLACSAVGLSALEGDAAPILLSLWAPAPSRGSSRTYASSRHARSVQQGMASSEFQTGAFRRASAARQAAASASARGENIEAARQTNYAIDALRAAERGAAASGAGPGAFGVQEGWTPEEAAQLEEYALLFAQLVVEDPETPSDARARLAEIGTSSPAVMEAYAGLLLYTYRDPDFDCSPWYTDGG